MIGSLLARSQIPRSLSQVEHKGTSISFPIGICVEILVEDSTPKMKSVLTCQAIPSCCQWCSSWPLQESYVIEMVRWSLL